LTERVRFLFSPNLWLFRCANPKVWMIWFINSTKSFSPSPLLQSNLLSLTWYFKDTRLKLCVQLFWVICINLVSTWC
jgi:hypothetical protein